MGLPASDAKMFIDENGDGARGVGKNVLIDVLDSLIDNLHSAVDGFLLVEW